MLKLKRYSFSGIGRFTEKQVIDLDSRSHLIQIDGLNTNTGGSSGAGKSTTVEALAFLLGISEIPATQLQSRITDDPLWVQAEFEGGITITRSKKDGLVVETPEETVSGNSKLAEEKLDEIIGVNRDLLKTMCYKRQKQGGFFLNLTPKQSYEFLTECLDLKEFQAKISTLEDLLKNKYKPRKIELESSSKTLSEGINQLEVLLSQKTKPESMESVNTNDLELSIQVLLQKKEVLKKQFDSSLESLGLKPEKQESSVFEKQEELDRVNKEISDLNIIINKNTVSRGIEVEQAMSAITKIREKINDITQLKKRMVEIDEEVVKLEEQRDHLSKGNCPTCLREWQNKSLTDKLEELSLTIGKKKDLVQSYIKEVEKYPHYKMMEQKALELLENKKNAPINILEQKDREELQEKQRVLLNEKENIKSVENQKFLEQLNQWNQNQKQITDIYNTQKSPLEEGLLSNQRQLDKIKNDKDNYEKALKTYETDCNNIKDKISLNKTQLEQQLEELKKIEKNTTLSEESIRLIKNFTLQKFQDTLVYIGNRATEIINLIPNMANSVIFFENSKETKSGNIKNEINAIINLESDGAVPIKTLSGGERTSADFAIDLAVGEMIESMTQKGINFLIIDEGFDGLDSISKIECLEILKNLNTDKKILMVDHSSEVKEMLHDTIVVKRIGEKSFIQ